MATNNKTIKNKVDKRNKLYNRKLKIKLKKNIKYYIKLKDKKQEDLNKVISLLDKSYKKKIISKKKNSKLKKIMYKLLCKK
ncbi:MAG: hypothetical protein ABPD24_00370 [Candidatus Shikimatogenerans sp. AspAUS03]|uniref:30S ribosomal protein S20 n=1 Tax=Candidatus Shikimatogenerans sp. AspAUS03 TaxID=3158563 RepID=A0AAU7QSG9_9FLAO